ncbi:DUF1906 domain-containing protein [Frigoribacterium faeni]|uniref:glycoside hydrolase domain-containing protein n=1 Tax=Frigoribacterium faeni TaxID=145483 RepID=UPI001FAD92A8|nr:glycoside hydrolase domain-containing protein [Frigoribacterium faeni]MCJ0700222.1 DUF1906 domain-containing protein [Frigoribacterium faeni]
MADPWVKNTQTWLNATYGAKAGWVTVTADGQGGNATVAALTRALQVELGITSLSSNFGDGTLTALTRFGNIDAQTSNKNIVRIVQGGLYVKGYNAGNGELDGVFPSSAAASLRTDMGVGSAASITPKVFKALLTTDAAVLIAGGNATIRRIQQDLNGRYSGRRDFYVGPTDGIYSRNVQQALMFAIQYEIGMADGTANGNFGPGTQSGLKTQGIVSTGSRDSSKYFVHLFQAALNFNGYSVPYDGVYGATTESVVRTFQTFAVLPVTGSASYATWASLLVSTGDPTRPAAAADCVTTITPARAATLVANGYKTIGRYLTNTPDNIPDKNIKAGELATIFAAGMTVFPIFQTGGATPSHFTSKRGGEVAEEAHNAALGYGFKPGTIIYFAVDWDALDQDIDTKIIPYFQAVKSRFAAQGNRYRIGIYGPRNICSRIAAAGYSVSSFVSGMSTAYSGNLGFRLPTDWAFDQIATVTIGSGEGRIEIDRNVMSGRNAGENSVVQGHPNSRYFDWLETVQRLAEDWIASGRGTRNIPASQLVLQFMRFPTYGTGGRGGSLVAALQWDYVADPCDVDFIAWAETQVGRVYSFTEQGKWKVQIGTEHFAATADGYRKWGIEPDLSVNVGDGGGLAGDFYTLLGQWLVTPGGKKNGVTPTSYVEQHLAIAQPDKDIDTFARSDFFEDIDGMIIGTRLRSDPSQRVSTMIRNYYLNEVNSRFQIAEQIRFAASEAKRFDVVDGWLTDTTFPIMNVFRSELIKRSEGAEYFDLTSVDLLAFTRAFIAKWVELR